MAQAQFIGQIVNDVILFATLLVIVWYTLKTADMANATKLTAESAQKTIEEMRETRDQDSAPYIICSFEAGTNVSLIYFVVRNTGKSVAHHVHLSITPPLVTSHGPLANMDLLTEGIASLAPGQEIRTLFDSTIGLFGHEELPLRYTVQATYSGGLTMRARSAEQTLDLAVYRGLFYVNEKGMDELVKAVESLDDHLGEVEDHLDDISGRLDKGLWLRNPTLTPGACSADMAAPVADLIAKLREFQLVWEASPRDDEHDVVPFRIDLLPHTLTLSQQIVALLAVATDQLEPDLSVTILRIATDLLRLGTMKFYMDGGRSIKQFTEAGDDLAARIKVACSQLAQPHALTTPLALDDAESASVVVSPNADTQPGAQEPTNDHEEKENDHLALNGRE